MPQGAAAQPLDVSALMQVLRDHFVLALATVDASGAPYSAPLYYAVMPAAVPVLLFASDPASAHGTHLDAGPSPVSAAIFDETEAVQTIRGVQIEGVARRLDAGTPGRECALETYLGRHPVARPMLGPEAPQRLYALVVRAAKLTDNARLGLGRHATWTFSGAWDTLDFKQG